MKTKVTAVLERALTVSGVMLFSMFPLQCRHDPTGSGHVLDAMASQLLETHHIGTDGHDADTHIHDDASHDAAHHGGT